LTINNDIIIYYSYERDTRSNKETFPQFLKKDIIIAIWNATKMEKTSIINLIKKDSLHVKRIQKINIQVFVLENHLILNILLFVFKIKK
jgi:hypothetical protein